MSATFCWGLSQIVGKLALRKTSTITFNTIRFTVPALIFAVFSFLTGSFKGIEFNFLFLVAIITGILGWFVGSSLLFYTLKRDSAHRITPVGNSYPLWAIISASLLLRESISAIIPFSTFLVLIGIYLIGSRKKGDEHTWAFGIPLALFASITLGMGQVLRKFVLTEGMVRSNLLLILLISAASCHLSSFCLRSIVDKKSSPNFEVSGVFLSAFSGIIGLLISQAIYLKALAVEKASTLAPITGGTIMFAFLLSIAILGESPTKKSVIGMVSILGAIILISL